MGFLFYLLFVYLLAMILHCVLFAFSKKYQKVEKVKGILHDQLYWGPLSRLLMESFMEILLLSFVSTETMFWHQDLPALAFSNTLGIILKVAYVGLPVLLILFVARMVAKWDSEEFK